MPAPDAPEHTTWAALIDCTLPDQQRACIFCGASDFRNRRSLFLRDVAAIVASQHKRFPEPVNTCMSNVLAAAGLRFEDVHGVAADEAHGAAGDACPGDEHTEPVVVSCMCCYHWVCRRQFHDFVRMPLQNIYWYVKSLDFHKRRNYDARIMHRLARAVSAPTTPVNFYSTLFSAAELAVLREAADGPVTEFHAVLARHYYANNGQPIFLPDAQITDAVRSATRPGADPDDDTTGE